MTNGRIYSTTGVARRLGIQRYQLDYLLETGQVPEPELRVAGKRVWTMADLNRVAEFLQGREARPTGRPQDQGIPREGSSPDEHV